MGLVIDIKTKKVINHSIKQSVEPFDIAITLFRVVFIIGLLALRFNLI